MTGMAKVGTAGRFGNFHIDQVIDSQNMLASVGDTKFWVNTNTAGMTDDQWWIPPTQVWGIFAGTKTYSTALGGTNTISQIWVFDPQAEIKAAREAQAAEIQSGAANPPPAPPSEPAIRGMGKSVAQLIAGLPELDQCTRSDKYTPQGALIRDWKFPDASSISIVGPDDNPFGMLVLITIYQSDPPELVQAKSLRLFHVIEVATGERDGNKIVQWATDNLQRGGETHFGGVKVSIANVVNIVPDGGSVLSGFIGDYWTDGKSSPPESTVPPAPLQNAR